jgi:BASS family bile acid:Na+ symporter
VPRADAALAFLGRHATAFMAGGVLLGLAVPPLAALAKPLLIPTLLIPLTLALIRLDWSALAAWHRKPGLAIALLAFVLFVSPLLVWVATAPLMRFGFPAELRQALILMAASSPIVSAVPIALLVGLDSALALLAVLLATALVPFTLPPMAAALTGIEIASGVGEFMLRLIALVGSAFAAAWIVRRLARPSTLQKYREQLDGVNVINLIAFGVAIMDGVTAYAFRRPAYVATALLAAYAFNLLLQATAYIAFRRLGRRGALTAALVSGNCNMGLVLVAVQDRASFEVTVFFALGQIPMYTLPTLLGPLYRRVSMLGAAAERKPR